MTAKELKKALANVPDDAEVYNEDLSKSLSQRLEDVIDRALTIIENREWDTQ